MITRAPARAAEPMTFLSVRVRRPTPSASTVSLREIEANSSGIENPPIGSILTSDLSRISSARAKCASG